MSKHQEVENSFWIEYSQELIEELNFRVVLDWLDSGYPLTDRILMVGSIEFKGIKSFKKKQWLKRVMYFIKRLVKKKRRKE